MSCLKKTFISQPADFCHMGKEKLIVARFSNFSGEAGKLDFFNDLLQNAILVADCRR